MPDFWHINALRMRGILGEKIAADMKVSKKVDCLLSKLKNRSLMQ